MKKAIVLGIAVLFMGLAIIPSINANDSILPVKSKLVDTSIRIYRDRGITPFTLKLTEKESDEIGRIFDNLKVSLDSAETGEEIDEIYDNAVESLYKLGMFPRMTVEDAKQLVNGKSVKSQSGIIGSGDDNFNCRILGQTTKTYMFDLPYPFWNSLLTRLRFGGYPNDRVWIEHNFRYFYGKIGFFSFGMLEVDRWWHHNYYYPSEGWVWTNGTNGVVRWDGSFYGDFKRRCVQEQGGLGNELNVYMGVSNFKGLFIDKRNQPPCYLGNAEHVSLTYDEPPVP